MRKPGREIRREPGRALIGSLRLSEARPGSLRLSLERTRKSPREPVRAWQSVRAWESLESLREPRRACEGVSPRLSVRPAPIVSCLLFRVKSSAGVAQRVAKRPGGQA